MDALYSLAEYRERYGLTLKRRKEDMVVCSLCGHICHCSNGGICIDNKCDCISCEHVEEKAKA